MNNPFKHLLSLGGGWALVTCGATSDEVGNSSIAGGGTISFHLQRSFIKG